MLAGGVLLDQMGLLAARQLGLPRLARTKAIKTNGTT